MEDLAAKQGNEKLKVLAAALDEANGKYLENNKAPSRKACELDNRGSHFYLALYWAQALAAQSNNAELQQEFAAAATALASNETTILAELQASEGKPVDIGGYYHPKEQLVTAAMRPSATFNAIVDAI